MSEKVRTGAGGRGELSTERYKTRVPRKKERKKERTVLCRQSKAGLARLGLCRAAAGRVCAAAAAAAGLADMGARVGVVGCRTGLGDDNGGCSTLWGEVGLGI